MKRGEEENPVAPSFDGSTPYACVRILSGEDLGAFDINGKSDPYIKVFFKNMYIGITPVCEKTLNPSWRNGAGWVLNVTRDELKESPKLIHCEVWDRDKLKKDEFMGECFISGEKILETKTRKPVYIKLHPKDEKKKARNEGKGGLNMEMYYCEPKLPDDYVAALASETSLGEKEIEDLYEVVQQVTLNRGVISNPDQLEKILDRSDKLKGFLANLAISGQSRVYQK
jgi:C2 domain